MRPVRRGLIDRRGAVTILFAFAVIPLLVAVGCAVDYSQAARSRTHIARSADAAALAAAKTAQAYMNTNGTGAAAFAAATLLAQAAMTQTFAANQSNDSFSRNATAVLTLTQDASGAPLASVAATASAPTSFMRLVGIASVPVAASAQAKAGGGTFYQIVFVVDVSNSMAIGGTSADIANLNADKYIATGNADGSYTPCAFACHDPNHQRSSYASDYCSGHVSDYFCHAYGPLYCPWGANGCARIPTTAFADKRAFAKQYGYKLKIDYTIDAINAFVAQLTPYMNKAPSFYSVGVSTFGTGFTQLTFNGTQTMTSDPTALTAAVATIDLENAAPYVANYGFTYTTVGLQSALANLSNVGDGSTATKRKTFIVFISDGAEDVPTNPVWPYGRSVDVNYGSACTALKNSGDPANPNTQPVIFSIDTTYYPVPNDAQYSQLISSKGLDVLMPKAMQGCATATSQYQTYFQASDGPAIKAAVQQVFANIFGGSLHLSR